MGLEYKHYKEKFEKQVIGNLKADLKKKGMLETAQYVYSDEDQKRIDDLREKLREERSLSSPDSKKILLLKEELEQAKNPPIDIKNIEKFFKGIDKRLDKDDSLEELEEIEKKLSKFENEFTKKERIQRMMTRSFNHKDADIDGFRESSINKAAESFAKKAGFAMKCALFPMNSALFVDKKLLNVSGRIAMLHGAGESFRKNVAKMNEYAEEKAKSVGEAIAKKITKVFVSADKALYGDDDGLMMELESNKRWRERKAKAAQAAALVRKSCKKARDYINRMKMSKKFKQVQGRQRPVYIYNIRSPKQALKTGRFEFLLPFMGGQEPVQVWKIEGPNGKRFEFDRNFLTRFKGMHLDVVVNQFCDFFKKEIIDGYYMQFDFRDKEDVFRICEELAKRNVKLDLEKMDLPNEDKYKLVGIYIKNLIDDGNYTFATRTRINPETNNPENENYISKSELRKSCTRVKVTPGLQEYIWKNHQVRISDGTELTPDQKNSSTAEIRMPDFVDNSPVV